MQLSEAGLERQPFRTSGKPLVVFSYSAHRAAVEFLAKTYLHKHGLGLMQGPALSGKSTMVSHFLDSLDREVSTAIVDGDGLDTTALLETVLSQFGYDLELTSVNELIGMLRVFAMQQTVAGNPPMLVVENTHLLKADVLHVLCDLADVKANRQSAIRLILLSDRSIEHIVRAPAMECVAARVTGTHHVGPMTALESRDFVHAKLSAAGAHEPADIIPDAVCADLYAASGGWPGVIDRLALFALAEADACPIAGQHVRRGILPDEFSVPAPAPATVTDDDIDPNSPPRLYLTRGGKTLGEVTLENTRLLIGRSEHNDLRINSKVISRHHAMFVRHGTATLLMDLNSTNGTFVNSRRVSNYVMMNDDVISIGNHRLKFTHPAAQRDVDLDDAGIADTVIMKTLDDMRQMRDMLRGASTQTMPLEALAKIAAQDSET